MSGMERRAGDVRAWPAGPSLRYGREWNASLAVPLPGGLAGLVKVADYRADGFARDNTKVWLQVEWHGARTLSP